MQKPEGVSLIEVKRNTDKGVQTYWQARWYTGRGGQRATKNLGNKKQVTKTVARRMCDEIARGLIQNPCLRGIGDTPKLRQWTDQYLELRTDLKVSSGRLHQETIDYLLDYFGDDIKIDGITRIAASKWRAWLSSKSGKSPGSTMAEATVCRHIRTAKTIFGSKYGASKLDLISINPFDREIGTAPAPDKDWQELTETDINNLIESCNSVEWKALVGLCAFAGLRRGEALRLTWNDIHWDKNRLVVRNADGSVGTKAKRREVYLENQLATLLLDVREMTNGLYVADVSKNNLHVRMEQIARRAGFEQMWSKPFHTLRKYRDTTWKMRHPEYVVDAWMGHGLEVSRKHYVRVPENYYNETSDNGVTNSSLEAKSEQCKNTKVLHNNTLRA